MNALPRILNQPEYVHAAINHFPLVGMFIAMLALIAGLIARSQSATFIALILLALTALSIWPVYHFGEEGYDRVLSMADDPGQAYLRYHAELAGRWAWLYYVTAGLAALACGLGIKWPKWLLAGSIISLLLATASLVAGIYIAQAGGEIRHREFRFGPAPASKITRVLISSESALV